MPNTRKVRLNDVTQLYTGTQIEIGYKFGIVFTSIFCCLMFSNALPILYPITAFYFLFTYWYDKFCLLKFNQRTKVFNEQLPISSLRRFKYAIGIHMMSSLVFYLSTEFVHDHHIHEKEHF